MEIVIALYNEDVSWVRDVYQKYKITIYNKSNKYPNVLNDLIKNNQINYFELKNVGRESHTYIHHILLNYNNLPDKIFFTQADPFDHLIKKQIAPKEFFFNILDNFNNNQNSFKGYGAKHYLWKIGINDRKQEICKKLYQNMFTNEFEDWFFNNGGIFGVTKEEILLRNKDFYNYGLEQLNKNSDPLEGFCFERLWSCIFNKKYINSI